MNYSSVTVYGIRRLNRTGYVYVGSTVQPIEERIKRHIMDSIGKRHSNRQLSLIIKKSKNMIVADVLAICSKGNRAKIESKFIHKLFSEGHKLVNITEPINPRQRLSYLTNKGKENV